MPVALNKTKIPRYNLAWSEPDKPRLIKVQVAHQQTFQQRTEFLTPHRKNYFLLVYVKQGTGRHWVDMVPYELKADTLYFTTPEQVHLKEEATLSGLILSITPAFFALAQNQPLASLPLIQNQQNGHELPLDTNERAEVDAVLQKLVSLYQPIDAEWQEELVSAYLHILLILLSRIYNRQYPKPSPDVLPAVSGLSARKLPTSS